LIVVMPYLRREINRSVSSSTVNRSVSIFKSDPETGEKTQVRAVR